MRTLILAAGRFGDEMREKIRAAASPGSDVFELATALGADVIDYLDVDSQAASWVSRTAGLRPRSLTSVSGAQAIRRHPHDRRRHRLAAEPRCSRRARPGCSHTMIAHTLFPAKKQVFFTLPAGAATGSIASSLTRPPKSGT